MPLAPQLQRHRHCGKDLHEKAELSTAACTKHLAWVAGEQKSLDVNASALVFYSHALVCACAIWPCEVYILCDRTGSLRELSSIQDVFTAKKTLFVASCKPWNSASTSSCGQPQESLVCICFITNRNNRCTSWHKWI